MRFSAINAVAVLSAASLTTASPVAAPVPAAPKGWASEPKTGGNARRDLAVRSTETNLAIHKREIITAIVTAAGTAAVTAIAEAAVKQAGTLISQIANFDNAREEFTKATVKSMADANPDPAKFVATICYNQGYDLENPAGMDGLTSVKITSGPLNTDYDCFYMTAPNAFFSRGDGGFINLAIMNDDRCTFDSATADLRCP